MNGQSQLKYSMKIWILLLTFIISANGHSGISQSEERSKATDVLARNRRAATSGLVDIAQFVDTSSPTKQHIVYVDDTMTRFIFEVTVYRTTPIIIPTIPSGVPYNKHPTLVGNPKTGDGKVVATYDVPVTAADYGFWKFQKMDASKWEVKVKAESPVSIKQQLFELGTNNPINGNPTIGSSYRLVITVTGFSNIQSANLAFFFSKSKLSPIGMSPVVDKGNGKFEAASVKAPSDKFMVGIQGKDKSNHMLRRLDVTEIVPVTVDLQVPPYTGATITEYKTFNISFVVTNLLNTSQDIDVRIEDTRGYAQAPKFLSATLKVGENFTGTFVLKAEFAGLTTCAKITARQYLGTGAFSPGPEESRNFTVISNQTTLSQPSTTPPSKSSVSTKGITKKGASQKTTASLVSGKTKPSGSSGLASSAAPGSTGSSAVNSQNSTAQGASSGSTGTGGPSHVTLPSNQRTKPAQSKETKDSNSDDTTSGVAVPLVVGLIVAGVIIGVLIGVGIVVAAIHLLKKSKAKKVDEEPKTPKRPKTPKTPVTPIRPATPVMQTSPEAPITPIETTPPTITTTSPSAQTTPRTQATNVSKPVYVKKAPAGNRLNLPIWR